MLVVFMADFYYRDMKNKIIFTIIGIIASLATFCVPAFADESFENHLFFRAVNAGYKDDASSQNYDFFELYRDIEQPIELSQYRVQYYNSSDKLADEFSFGEASILQHDSAVFGYGKSPQFVDLPAQYLYTFSSSGLASTAGRLRLVFDDEVVDEICWGKLTCDNHAEKFATGGEENMTAIRCVDDECESEFLYEKYYPSIDIDAVVIPEPEVPEIASCAGLKITELYSYYENDASEQFIEIINTSPESIALEACLIRFKNKDYPLQGSIAPNEYYLAKDIPLTKNPSSSLTVELIDGNGVVDSINYDHGQKRGTSVALIDGQ